MIRFAANPEDGTLELVLEPPYEEMIYAQTTVCIHPDPCPECGQCLLCDSLCKCEDKSVANCSMAITCNARGHCLAPASCTHTRPTRG